MTTNLQATVTAEDGAIAWLVVGPYVACRSHADTLAAAAQQLANVRETGEARLAAMKSERDEAWAQVSDMIANWDKQIEKFAAVDILTGALERAAGRGHLVEWGFARGGNVCVEWKCHACDGKYMNAGAQVECINDHCISVIATRALAEYRERTGKP